MARVVVVGGGFGGLAAAARLAKLGHDVTLTERS
ncbi:FAD-dependent oxidoreductase, partial [Nocardioides sp.]